VRTDRFRYVRNYHPERPYRLQNGYHSQHPAKREINRLAAADALDGDRAFWLRDGRPPEELYDLAADPHETDNLAGDPDHRATLKRLRGALDDWIDRTDDLGLGDERPMVESFRSDGEQPTTATPDFAPNVPGNRCEEVRPGGSPDDPPVLTADGPAECALICATEGASMTYRFGDDGLWTLYTGPFRLPGGETTVEARANRYGYADSDRVALTVAVDGTD
jgi:hypothetical protein